MKILQISFHTAPFGNTGKFDSGGLNLSLSQSGLDPLPARQLKYLEDWSFL